MFILISTAEHPYHVQKHALIYYQHKNIFVNSLFLNKSTSCAIILTMIELIDAVIMSKSAPKEPCSFSYEKGQINYIDYSETYKFNFLMLKNQSLDTGTFKIDEKVFFPQEENEYSLFFITVNSLAKFHLCFVDETKNKKEHVKTIQEALVKLRELPIETDEDKDNKVIAIFDCVQSLNPSYLLIDFNDSANEKEEFLKGQLQKLQNSTVVIALNKKPVEEVKEEPVVFQEEALEISIGAGSEHAFKEKKEPKKKAMVFKQKGESSFGKVFAQMFKENYMVFLSFLAPALGVIAFSLLSPLYAQTNKVLLMPFIITIVICFVLYMIMTYKCAEFENRQQLIAYAIINAISILIAFGLSILFYVLFLNFDNDIKALNSKNVTGFVIAIILAIVLMTACLYVPPIVKSVLKLFKKKK